MTDEIIIAQHGHAGWITLNRPQALNALTHEMCLAIEHALDRWRDNADIAHVVIEGAGERAFCAGGDVVKLYEAGRAGEFAYGRKFWRDEYRLNAKIYHYPKPYIAFLQGFTMGGGVGISCHGSHRIVGESSRIAMPECGIGFVPDVGGSLLLARAAGHLGEYLGTTGARMQAGDAIYAGFADHYIPEEYWPALKQNLQKKNVADAVSGCGKAAPESAMAGEQHRIDKFFVHAELSQIVGALSSDGGEFSGNALKMLLRASPLSAACALRIVREVRKEPSIERALEWEYRFTSRATEFGDFLEGVRAAIIDKDNNPRWRHADRKDVPPGEIAGMLAKT
ncbi:MAG: enoyl-CoA hydratase/isomerase family protein [Hyphomicrobiales bacterium]|nr:enoyl-CoA hydratase/isomerase family protein [Hyphomicrobiales bacterium]